MKKAPAGLVQKRQGYATEPFKKAVLFFTPLRTIQLLGFGLIFAFSMALTGTKTFEAFDRPFYDSFLKYQPPPKIDPSIVYIGIDKQSLQAINPFPWPKRYYAAITRILREWGAKSIAFDLYFTQGAEASEDDQALREEFKKTSNFFLPLSFDAEGFKNHYFVNQTAPFFAEYAHGIGHANYSLDPDRVVRRVYPFVKFNQKLLPHLGILVAYDFLGRPVPTLEQCDFPRDEKNNLLIHWAKRWNDTARYYSFVDVLNGYALVSKGQASAVKPEDFKGKICLVGLTAADFKATPLESASPSLGALGNIINTILTGQYIRVISPGLFAALLFVLAIVTGLILIPFRSVFSILGILLIAGLWILGSFALFSGAGIWSGVAGPLFLIFGFFLLSFVVARIQSYREQLYFLKLAVRDELTGLFVMRYISTLLAQAFTYSRTFKKPFSVILLDIDDFRKINEAHGYRTGDGVLKKIAKIIQDSIRTQGRAMPDAAGRYGEEEFIVLLSGYNLATATFGVAERIRKAIERMEFHTPNGQSFKVTASTGVSVLKLEESEPQKVIERAQEALLKAKAEGKNRTCILNN